MHRPPPPCALFRTTPGFANPNHRLGTQPPKLSTLSPPILLQIVYHTFPKSHLPGQDNIERQRNLKTLYWLSTHLRLVNRALYAACMHVLRSAYLPMYSALIRPPYTSDPLPVAALEHPLPSIVSEPSSPGSASDTSAQLSPPAYPSSPTFIALPIHPAPTVTPHMPITSPLKTIQRETSILNYFITLQVRQDVFSDESELHLERQHLFKDLFDVAQPRARLEDLVRVYGMRMGLVSIPGVRMKTTTVTAITATTPKNNRDRESKALSTSPPSITLQSPNQKTQTLPQPRKSLFSLFKHSPPSYPSTPQKPRPTPIPFASLSISFSPRHVGLMINRTRTIVEVPRSPGRRETLETLAAEVVRGLGEVLESE